MVRTVVCFGDSNTYGYYPTEDERGYGRFDETQRWPRLLQKQLGEGYLILEEGLCGRTTAFDDPLRESMNGLKAIYTGLMCHEPVDLLIVMLGTNDVKERLGLEAGEIGQGMKLLLQKARSLPAWGGEPNILLMAPPVIREDWNPDYSRKSREVVREYRLLAEETGCHFLDVGAFGRFNDRDHMHLTMESHRLLAEQLSALVPELIKKKED